MKRLLLLIPLLIICGCEKQDTGLDNFKSYLEKKYQFICEEKICTSDSSVGNVIKYHNEIDFEKNTYEHSTTGISSITSTSAKYNWKDQTGHYESKEVTILINADYDYNTGQINCTSDFDNKGYVDNKCNTFKKELDELKKTFEQLIEESETTYFDE